MLSAGLVGGGGGGGSSSTKTRPSSRSRRSALKDLLGKGYRCLALLEELGAVPLLNSAADVVMGGEDETDKEEHMMGRGGKDRLSWWHYSGKLMLEDATRRRLSAVDPFHEV